MAQNKSRYFKLSDDILLEYVYTDIYQSRDGECYDLIDLSDHNMLYVDNSYDNKRYIFSKDVDDTFGGKGEFIHNSVGTLALPINKMGSKYIKAANVADNKKRYWGNNSLGKISNAGVISGEDLFYDTVILHFTGKNYWGSYANYIIKAEISDFDSNPINIASIIFKKDDDVENDANQLFINQKIYTTHITFRIPSTSHLISLAKGKDALVSSFSPKYKRFEANTPIKFSLIGAKNSFKDTDYEYYTCETVNTITVPHAATFSEVSVKIEEAGDGDYFVLTPMVSTNKLFSDYILSKDDHPEAYVVMHEISLIECWVGQDNSTHSAITHREYYMVNVEDAISDEAAKNMLDTPLKYRPVCMYSNVDVKFIIEDTLKILNTIDNTTVVVKSSMEYPYPNKYGKKLNRINLGETPAQLNVYNRRTDTELDSVLIHNSKGNELKVENHQYSIQEFVECTNIGVSIQDISAMDVE